MDISIGAFVVGILIGIGVMSLLLEGGRHRSAMKDIEEKRK